MTQSYSDEFVLDALEEKFRAVQKCVNVGSVTYWTYAELVSAAKIFADRGNKVAYDTWYKAICTWRDAGLLNLRG